MGTVSLMVLALVFLPLYFDFMVGLIEREKLKTSKDGLKS